MVPGTLSQVPGLPCKSNLKTLEAYLHTPKYLYLENKKCTSQNSNRTIDHVSTKKKKNEIKNQVWEVNQD